MALTTIQRLREYLGQSVMTKDDGLLVSLLDSASAFFEREVGRSIGLATYTDIVDGDCSRSVMLKASPVVEVTRVVVNGEDVVARPTWDGEGWVLQGDRLRFVGSIFPTCGVGNVEVTYTAGWEVIPDDVQGAVCELAAMKYRGRDSLGVFSRAVVGQEQTMYQTVSLPIQIQRVIDNYRIPVVA